MLANEQGRDATGASPERVKSPYRIPLVTQASEAIMRNYRAEVRDELGNFVVEILCFGYPSMESCAVEVMDLAKRPRKGECCFQPVLEITPSPLA